MESELLWVSPTSGVHTQSSHCLPYNTLLCCNVKSILKNTLKQPKKKSQYTGMLALKYSFYWGSVIAVWKLVLIKVRLLQELWKYSNKKMDKIFHVSQNTGLLKLQ